MNTVGLLLTHMFSPFKKICEVPLYQIQSVLLSIFDVWGLPQWIKVDNGRPFGDPQRQTGPVLALWLIPLGVRVIFNRPRIPQDNAKVERSQGVLSNWTEWHKCHNTAELQNRLSKEAKFHNSHYPVNRLNGQTRLQAFPTLTRSPKDFNINDFEVQRALDFVAQGHWERTVSQSGQINLWGNRVQVGLKYAYQNVSVKLDPLPNLWQVFNQNGILLKSFESKITPENLWRLDIS